MIVTPFSDEVRLQIDQARREFEAGSDIAWLAAAHAAIGHQKAGGAIWENPFSAQSEARLHEAWNKYFDARNKRVSSAARWARPRRGSTQAAHAAAALED